MGSFVLNELLETRSLALQEMQLLAALLGKVLAVRDARMPIIFALLALAGRTRLDARKLVLDGAELLGALAVRALEADDPGPEAGAAFGLARLLLSELPVEARSQLRAGAFGAQWTGVDRSARGGSVPRSGSGACSSPPRRPTTCDCYPALPWARSRPLLV